MDSFSGQMQVKGGASRPFCQAAKLLNQMAKEMPGEELRGFSMRSIRAQGERFSISGTDQSEGFGVTL